MDPTTDLKDYYALFTVIIPTLNEGDNIKSLVKLLTEFYPGMSIIVTDDGSKDNTQSDVLKIIDQGNSHVKLLNRSDEKIKGLTASVLDGIRDTKTEYFIVMDGDLQHPPEYIHLLIEKILQEFDIVVAVRDDIIKKWSIQRTIMQRGAAIIGKMRLVMNGISLKDPMSGFFAGKRDFVVDLINKNEHRFMKEGYKVLFDLLKIIPSNTSVGSIRFEFSRRSKGNSKMNSRIAGLFLKSLFK